MFTFDNVSGVFGAMLLLRSVVTRQGQIIRDPLVRLLWLGIFCLDLYSAITAFRIGYYKVGAVTVGWAVLFAYDLWNSRPNKRKYIDRVLGRVKDLGHRLAVVNV